MQERTCSVPIKFGRRQDALQRQLNLPEQFVIEVDLEDIYLVEKAVPNPLLQVCVFPTCWAPAHAVKHCLIVQVVSPVQAFGRAKTQLELKQARHML